MNLLKYQRTEVQEVLVKMDKMARQASTETELECRHLLMNFMVIIKKYLHAERVLFLVVTWLFE